jgi:helix-turn-helix protein/macro domain-containing protein
VGEDARAPDPGRILTLADLSRELDRLRRRAARPGQVQLSVRDIAVKIGKAPSTLDPYLRGQRLCPADVYEEILRVLGVSNERLRPWLDAWDRLADEHAATRGQKAGPMSVSEPALAVRPRPLAHTEEFHYALAGDTDGPRIGIVTGDLRRVRCAEVWVNPENTSMQMARFEEYSTSAIIRYHGALRDRTGHVARDPIAEELSRKVAGRVPVAPGTAIATGAGELAQSNGVRNIIHVAAVHGEPGEGYRQVCDVGSCATNALAELARLNVDLRPSGVPLRTVLFPLLGCGQGGGAPVPTVIALLGAVLDNFAGGRHPAAQMVYFLAYTDVELEVCQRVFASSSRLVAVPRS